MACSGTALLYFSGRCLRYGLSGEFNALRTGALTDEEEC
jgi:hypothetical protein